MLQEATRDEPLVGAQTPTHLLTPTDVAYSDIDAALEIAEIVGIELDPWQVDFLTHGLGRRRTVDGGSKWAAYEAGIELSRQNGKSVIFELRALAGLFVFGEELIIYSAHKGQTAIQAYRRMVKLIEHAPDLKREVKGTPSANGKEAIILHSGAMIQFRTRTPDGGRGLTGDCVIIDEVQGARDDHVSALIPAMAAKSVEGDPQIWYGGSAGKRSSTILGRLVRRQRNELALRAEGGHPQERRLLMARFAADLDVDDPADPRVWARVNPAYGKRIDPEFIQQEFAAMGADLDPKRFAAERLGVGDYPREEGEDWAIPQRRVDAAVDEHSEMVGPVMFAVEVRMDRSSTAITVAGWRPDGAKHIECIADERGVGWAVETLKRVTSEHDNLGVILDPAGPANTLIGPLRDAGIPMTLLKASDVTAAWGKLYDGFEADPPTIYHRGGLVLTAAFSAAETRTVQGSTTWQRSTPETSGAVIAATWAAHGLDIAKKTERAAVSRRARPQRNSDTDQPRHFRPRRSGGFDPRNSGF
ncbi:hypothetical protein [Microbacterium karelineae]|uniref:hypothetical protein n=1 Tax=Microbacterium karelineae TaxID=2654283 RepID=UPI0012EAC005|nr:hypothetical protein [Microbacterium karelineae]